MDRLVDFAHVPPGGAGILRPGPLIGPIGYGMVCAGALTIHRNALLDIDGLLKMVWVNKPPWEGLVRGGFHLEFQWFIGI